MKDFLRQQANQATNELLKRSIVREYLQARTLQVIQESGAFMNWAFLGGTALRFLYSIPRYSEDLDFSIVNPDANHDFENTMRKIKSAFEAENYGIAVTLSPAKTVMSAFLNFSGLLYEMGISPHRREVFSIKIEIDTNPPPGVMTSTTIIRRFVTLNILHYNKASLFAGKLHAILSRQYTKGRDLYDLVWFLSDRTWPGPNLELLNAALKQTQWKGPLITRDNIQDVFLTRITHLRWDNVSKDLQPFIERPENLALITQANCIKLLQDYKPSYT